MSASHVFLAGLGGLGSWVLELLGRAPEVGRLTVVDRNADWGRRKVYNVITGLAFEGRYPQIDFHGLDLRDVEQVAALIGETRPDLLVNCATLQTWWLSHELDEDTQERLSRMGIAPWVPNHLVLARFLMQAHRESGSRAPVINAAFPDGVNAILGRRGLAPTIGVGNAALLVPAIQGYVSERLDLPMESVHPALIAHHFHTTFFRRGGPGDPPPYYLRVLADGRDVTGDFDHAAELCRASRLRCADDNLNPVVASALRQIALGLLSDEGVMTHAPGPRGLVGGYPVRVSSQGVELALPEQVSLEEAVAINEQAQRYDGIERIEEDGTLVCTQQAVAAAREVFGYDCSRLPLDECEARSAELRAKFQELLAAHGAQT